MTSDDRLEISVDAERICATLVSPSPRLPGVLLVLTAADIGHLGGLPCLAPVGNSDGSPMVAVPYPILAKDVVRHRRMFNYGTKKVTAQYEHEASKYVCL